MAISARVNVERYGCYQRRGCTAATGRTETYLGSAAQTSAACTDEARLASTAASSRYSGLRTKGSGSAPLAVFRFAHRVPAILEVRKRMQNGTP